MVQLENCVKYFNNLILNELKELGIETWVAGGSIRDYFCGKGITSDIDLYFKDGINLNRCKTYFLKTSGSIYFENDKVIKIERNKIKYDLVKTFFKNPQHSIESFDFTVCCGAVDNNNVYTVPTFFMDLAKKQLMINKIDYPISTLWRLQKYNKKGFGICKGELTKIIEAIQNAPKISILEPTINVESTMEFDEFYDSGMWGGID